MKRISDAISIESKYASMLLDALHSNLVHILYFHISDWQWYNGALATRIGYSLHARVRFEICVSITIILYHLNQWALSFVLHSFTEMELCSHLIRCNVILKALKLTLRRKKVNVKRCDWAHGRESWNGIFQFQHWTKHNLFFFLFLAAPNEMK